MKKLFEAIGSFICKSLHGGTPMYAGGRTFRCRVCLREKQVSHYNEPKPLAQIKPGIDRAAIELERIVGLR